MRKSKLTFVQFVVQYLDTAIVGVDADGNVYYYDEQLIPKGKDYLYVSVNKCGVPIHRIVAYIKYGIEYLYVGIEARHLNGIKSDNSWDNIAIGTHADNMHDIPADIWYKITHTTHDDTHDKRSIASRRYWAELTDQQRSDIMHPVAVTREATMPLENKSARAKHGWDTRRNTGTGLTWKSELSTEELSERSKRGWEVRRVTSPDSGKRTRATRIANGTDKGWKVNRSPESVSASANKGHETRRKNKLLKETSNE